MIVTPDLQPRWNTIIVDVLREFIDICKRQNYTYYVCGGTAIGAVRHHGIIPWDDDIDVFMPRPDYDKFLAFAKDYHSEKYEVLTPYTTEDYPMYFAKFSNKQTSLIENADIPSLWGLYIDVFPIDGAADDKDQAARDQACFRHEMNKLESISNHYSFSRYISLLRSRKEWGRFCRKTIGFLARQWYRGKILHRMEEICKHYDFKTSQNVMAYCGSYGSREVFPKEWLKGKIEKPFETLTVDLFSGYDGYLRQLYGDYMQLPPMSQRISHHTKAYFNLERRISKQELNDILRSLHNQQCMV